MPACLQSKNRRGILFKCRCRRVCLLCMGARGHHKMDYAFCGRTGCHDFSDDAAACDAELETVCGVYQQQGLCSDTNSGKMGDSLAILSQSARKQSEKFLSVH